MPTVVDKSLVTVSLRMKQNIDSDIRIAPRRSLARVSAAGTVMMAGARSGRPASIGT